MDEIWKGIKNHALVNELNFLSLYMRLLVSKTWFVVFFEDVGSNNSGYYELTAVLTHQGRSSSSGHYLAWIRRKGGKSVHWSLSDAWKAHKLLCLSISLIVCLPPTLATYSRESKRSEYVSTWVSNWPVPQNVKHIFSRWAASQRISPFDFLFFILRIVGHNTKKA